MWLLLWQPRKTTGEKDAESGEREIGSEPKGGREPLKLGRKVRRRDVVSPREKLAEIVDAKRGIARQRIT
jgi:hypothetical protein